MTWWKDHPPWKPDDNLNLNPPGVGHNPFIGWEHETHVTRIPEPPEEPPVTNREYISAWKWVAIIATSLVLLFGLSIGGCSGYKAWHRGQQRANANNRVALTQIQIRNQKAQDGVIQQQAYQRYIEATGIRKAQDEISKTLTPLYIQHEAIQAQEAEAQKPNNTIVYVPSGAQGVPLVKTTP